MLLNENDEVFTSDLKVDNSLADEHDRCGNVVHIKEGHLATIFTNTSEWIRHRHELVVGTDDELLLLHILWDSLINRCISRKDDQVDAEVGEEYGEDDNDTDLLVFGGLGCA